MVVDIQEFQQKDGRLVEKIICQNGFFYIDKCDLDIIDKYTFEVQRAGGQTSLMHPRTSIKIDGRWKPSSYAQCYYLKHKGVYLPKGLVLDHINGVELDNIKENLYPVTIQQNGYNQFKQGYTINLKGGKNGSKHTNYFATLKVKTSKGSVLKRFPRCLREDEVAKQQHILETQWFKQTYPNIFYMFDFTEWRRNDIDFLCKEREGVWSKVDAIKAFLMQDKFRLNPWYWCRFDLFDLYNSYGVTYPKENIDWFLDDDGAMRFMNGVLCRPFNWGTNQNRVNL